MDSEDNFTLSRSSLYDPRTDTWTELAPPWDYHGELPGSLSVVGLADGGALAVLSTNPEMGVGATGTQTALFDPRQGVWRPPVDVPIDDRVFARDDVVLGDGRVLMFGIDVAGTYLFDPATGSWDAGPALPFDPASAAVLDDGSVLALSVDGRSAVLPAGGVTWRRSGRPDVGEGAAVAAIRGGAIALGGYGRHCEWIRCPDPRSAVYGAETQRWSPGTDIPGAASGVARVLLPDGRLLAVGGWGHGTTYECVSVASIVSADAASWQWIEPMPGCIAYGAGRLQADGTVLIVGSGDVYIGGEDMGVGIVVLTYQP